MKGGAAGPLGGYMDQVAARLEVPAAVLAPPGGLRFGAAPHRRSDGSEVPADSPQRPPRVAPEPRAGPAGLRPAHPAVPAAGPGPATRFAVDPVTDTRPPPPPELGGLVASRHRGRTLAASSAAMGPGPAEAPTADPGPASRPAATFARRPVPSLPAVPIPETPVVAGTLPAAARPRTAPAEPEAASNPRPPAAADRPLVAVAAPAPPALRPTLPPTRHRPLLTIGHIEVSVTAPAPAPASPRPTLPPASHALTPPRPPLAAARRLARAFGRGYGLNQS